MTVINVIVDISADQFPDVDEKVIVVATSPWHDKLRIIEESPWAEDGDVNLYRRLSQHNVYLAYAEHGRSRIEA